MNYTNLLIALFPFLASVAGYFYHRLVQSLPQNKQTILLSATQIAVKAVEQTMNGADGTAKKSAATDLVVSILKEFHLSVNPKVVDAAIESVVNELKPTA